MTALADAAGAEDRNLGRFALPAAGEAGRLPALTEPLRPLPTSNRALPLRIASFATLSEGLDYAARGETGFTFFSGRGAPQETLSYAALREGAWALARRLAGLGAPRGSRIAVVAETSPAFLITFFACQYAGLVPMPLPLSVNLGSHGAYVRRLHGMLRSGRPLVAMAPAELLAMVREAAAGTEVRLVGTLEELLALPPAAMDPQPFAADEPSYLQYSSGSTTEPRGVPITQAAITANARAIDQVGLALRQGDRAVSWLPLYHDMGLVGFCLAPMLAQISVDLIATSAFAVRPRTWLKVIAEHGGTISYSPTFGYELCVRRAAKDDGGGFDLSRWRVAGVGGEMVRADVLAAFARLFAPAGFDARAFTPSYGLAEATLAVTIAPLARGVRVDVVDRERYEVAGEARPAGTATAARGTRAFVGCGLALPGYRLQIRDDDGRPLADRRIGRVCVAGPSLMAGYDGRPELTAEVLTGDGWLDTGDMGYLVDGELFITGRRKDMIICNGRNIWPQDLEWAVEQAAAVKSGSAAAFAVGGEEGERVVLAVECYVADRARQDALYHELMAIIQRTAGVHCEVILVPPRTLPYTSSGKLSRAAARAQYLGGTLPAVYPPPAGAAG